MNFFQIAEFLDNQAKMARARQQKHEANLSKLAFKMAAQTAVSSAIDLAIKVFGYVGVQLPDLKKLIRKLEHIILMIGVYGFVRQQTLDFRDLDHATIEGLKLMKDMRDRAKNLRHALLTIFTNLDYDAAVRFVNDLKATVPKEFWDMQWAIK